MKTITTTSAITEVIKNYKTTQKVVGLVPTMGALHSGHLSLIREAKNYADIVVVSIFVNKKQFNNSQDFNSYPRNLDKDLHFLREEDGIIVFAPSENEVYSDNERLNLDFGLLTKVLEAECRPGHFEGVAEVVSRFFNIIQPNLAFFGRKDYQQYLLIQELCKQLNLPIKIIGCETVRNEQGLALSSRNELLNDDQKQQALILYRSLIKAKQMIKGTSVSEIEQIIHKDFELTSLKLEYFEIVDGQTLSKIEGFEEKNQNIVALVAAYLGNVRLIDNLSLIP